MNRTQRVIFSDNGVLKDLSAAVNSYGADTAALPVVAAQDALYIGAELPFNHKHFEFGTANALASVASVSIWDGTQWRATLDLNDETQAAAGKTFSQRGALTFCPDVDSAGWASERISGDVTGLSGTKIYGLYWAKITFSADLTAGTTLKYVGERFATDTELFKKYPDLASADLMDAWETGKTSWDDQHLDAAEEIVRDLRAKNILIRREQILRSDVLAAAGINKAAEIIYFGMGTNYDERRKAAAAAYAASVNLQFFEVDLNADAVPDYPEKTHSMRFLSR